MATAANTESDAVELEGAAPQIRASQSDSSLQLPDLQSVNNAFKFEPIGEYGQLYINTEEQLKKGSFSKVFQGIRKGAFGEEKIAIKVIEELPKDNEREILNLSAVARHENIVSYYGSGILKYRGQKAIFIAMEECNPETLWDKIRSRKLTHDHYKCREYMIGIAKGINYIHDNGILHRDMKPQNILFKGDTIVVSDFGLSKRLQVGKSNTPHSGENVGTDGWRAPETYNSEESQGKNVVSKATDIYSCGLVFDWMLTDGKHPFGNNSYCWSGNIIEGKYDPSPLDSIPDGQVAKDLITRMLSRSAKERPSMKEVLSHPFMWMVDSERQAEGRQYLEFLGDVMKYVEFLKKSEDTSADFESSFSINVRDGKYGGEVLEDGLDWKKKLLFTDNELKRIRQRYNDKNIACEIKTDSMQTKAKKFKGDKVSELVRFIRNRYTYDHEDKGVLDFDMSISEFWQFFSTRFPYLFIFVYCKVEDHFKGKTAQDKDYSETIANYFSR